MTNWKTLDEILPEMGRAAEADPENWREQFEVELNSGVADAIHPSANLLSTYRYRCKPRSMKYTVERPEPMLKHPEKGQKCWIPNPVTPNWTSSGEWLGDDVDIRHFNRGLVYATKEEAVAAAKAMVGAE